MCLIRVENTMDTDDILSYSLNRNFFEKINKPKK